jgi:hypothetical protein
MKPSQLLKRSILVVAGVIVGALVSMKILRTRRPPILITRRTVTEYYKP